jgi:hypothetical protein
MSSQKLIRCFINRSFVWNDQEPVEFLGLWFAQANVGDDLGSDSGCDNCQGRRLGPRSSMSEWSNGLTFRITGRSHRQSYQQITADMVNDGTVLRDVPKHAFGVMGRQNPSNAIREDSSQSFGLVAR